LKYENLIEDISNVHSDLNSIEKDVKTESGKWYTMRIMPYRTEDNRIEGTVLTFFDITKRKHAEQKLKNSEQNYKEAYNQTEFYQDLLTHDFNNLLQVILLSINQIEDEVKKIKPEGIQRIKDQIERGKNLIENIQRLARIDEKESKNIEIDLIDFTKEQIKKVKKVNKEKNLKINTDYPKYSMKITASEFLDVALQNVINNSITHNDREPKKIDIRIGDYKEDDNEFFKLSVEDNGKGIPDDQKKKIREGTLPRKIDTKEGMGIGLSIVKKVMSLSKGEMWIENRVESDYTKGTRVVLLLRKAEESKS
jgi:two-component system CheB/CheR fusion protein